MRRVQILAPTTVTGVGSGSGTYTGQVTLEDFNFSTALFQFTESGASGTTAIEPIVQQYVDGSWIDVARGGSMTTNTTKNLTLRAPCDDKYVGSVGSGTLSASTVGTCIVSNQLRAVAIITSAANTSATVSCNLFMV